MEKGLLERLLNRSLLKLIKIGSLLIIDDGSIDNTKEIIAPFLSDKKIHYYYQNNQGVSIARNNGLAKCNGEFISLLDADDLWLERNLENRIKLFNENREVNWVFGSIKLINEQGDKLNETIIGSDKNLLRSLLSWNGNIITIPSTITIKKECLDKVKYDSSFSTAADQDFVFQLASNYIGKFLTEVSVHYRKVSNSISQDISLMEKDHIGVYKKASKEKLFKSWLFEKECFSNLYLILAGSWWKNGNNKKRGIYYMLLSIINYPLNIFKIIPKLFNA